MRRIFTKAVGLRYAVGKVHNYPVATWKQIEKASGLDLEDFTDEVDMVSARVAKADREKRMFEQRTNAPAQMHMKQPAPKHGVRR